MLRAQMRRQTNQPTPPQGFVMLTADLAVVPAMQMNYAERSHYPAGF